VNYVEISGIFSPFEHTSPFPPWRRPAWDTPVEGAEQNSAAQRVMLEVLPGLDEDVLVGTGAGKVDAESAYGNFYLCAYLEQFEPDAAAGGFGHACAF